MSVAIAHPNEWTTEYTLPRLDYVCDVLGVKGTSNGEFISPTLLYVLNQLGINVDKLMDNPGNIAGDQSYKFTEHGIVLHFNSSIITVVTDDHVWIRRLEDAFKAKDLIGV